MTTLVGEKGIQTIPSTAPEWIPSQAVCSAETKYLFQNKLKNKFKEFRNGIILLQPHEMRVSWRVKGWDAYCNPVEEDYILSCDGWDINEKDGIVLLKWSGMNFHGRSWRKLCKDIHRALKQRKNNRVIYLYEETCAE